jgi:RHS repeat-associated protein
VDCRYGFIGKEKDNELSGEGNSCDFGERMYDPRLGRWKSIDPKFRKYADLSPYSYGDNSPIWKKDDDGRDIIILSAPKGAGGFGHAAVLIGNDKDGWKLYSKNGTYGSSGSDEKSSGPSNHRPEIGVPFKTLKDFANSESNFNMEENGEVEYTSAFRITTDKATDAKMAEAATKQIGSDYVVIGASCIDVASDALTAGHLDPGNETYIQGQTGKVLTTKDPRPNQRYDQIKKNNKGIDATKSIQPSEDTKSKMQQNSEGGQQRQQDFEQKLNEQNLPANTGEEFGGG